MHVIILKLKIKPECVADFEKIMKQHIVNTKKGEPGCVEFDIAVDKEHPRTYHFFEIYADDKALADHGKSPSLANVREKTKDMAEERSYSQATLWPRTRV